jgi:hypothetical protein
VLQENEFIPLAFPMFTAALDEPEAMPLFAVKLFVPLELLPIVTEPLPFFFYYSRSI